MDSAGQGYPTTVSLYFNVIFCVFVVASSNYLLTQISAKFAVKQGELLTIYIMLAIASSIAGHDMLRVLIPMIPHAFWYASPENDWANLFHRFIPSWIAVSDQKFLADYYRGEGRFLSMGSYSRLVEADTCLEQLFMPNVVFDGLH